MKLLGKPLLTLILAMGTLTSFAEVPVEDLSENQSSAAPSETVTAPTPQAPVAETAPTIEDATPVQQYNDGGNSNISPTDRLSKLEQQMSYLQQMNLTAKMNSLEQSVQDLRGLVEMQAHQIQDLQLQMRNQYSDLNRRLSSSSSKSTGMNNIVAGNTTALGTSNSVTAPIVPKKNLATVDKEVSVYANAFNLIKKKQYADAISGLKIYLKQYPKGQYVASAHYWLGELWLISGNNNQAKTEFTTVTQQYPDSDKVADALFKLGSLAFDQSNFAEAKKNWQTLVNQYPDSSAARIATTRLDQLSQQGH